MRPILPEDDVAQHLDVEQRLRRLEQGKVDLGAPGQIIDVRRLNGQNEAYRAISTAIAFTVDAAGAIPLALTYTPPVDVWWEVNANLGVLQKLDANYHYAYGQLVLSPGDADGITAAPNILTQYGTGLGTGPTEYGWRAPRRMFKLTAGVAYTCSVTFSPQGGSWQFYQGKDYIYIEGKAITR